MKTWLIKSCRRDGYYCPAPGIVMYRAKLVQDSALIDGRSEIHTSFAAPLRSGPKVLKAALFLGKMEAKELLQRIGDYAKHYRKPITGEI